MHEIEVFAIVAILIVGAGGVALRRRRPSEEARTDQPSYCPVRVLTTDEEVRAAVVRAARFEQMAAASLEARTRRYQNLAGRTMPLPAHNRLAGLDAVDSAPPVP